MEARQLKIEDSEEKERVTREITILKKLKHPNLIHLFAFTMMSVGRWEKGNVVIQELMAEGDLKNYLKKMKGDEERRQSQKQIQNQKKKIWDSLLTWMIEVARGMEHLESLKIVHRDVAARYIPYLLAFPFFNLPLTSFFMP